MQDYQQNRKIVGASGGATAAHTASLFWVRLVTRQPTSSLITRGGTTGGFGTTTSQSATGSFGAIGQPQTVTGTMLGPKLVEELVRKSLLEETFVDTQFHLFSARSSKSGRVMKPRVLRANNALLAKSSKYFLGRRLSLHKGQ